jgi:hypothetical protein
MRKALPGKHPSDSPRTREEITSAHQLLWRLAWEAASSGRRISVRRAHALPQMPAIGPRLQDHARRPRRGAENEPEKAGHRFCLQRDRLTAHHHRLFGQLTSGTRHQKGQAALPAASRHRRKPDEDVGTLLAASLGGASSGPRNHAESRPEGGHTGALDLVLVPGPTVALGGSVG